MLRELAELWRYRGLLWVLVRRDLKVRYKNSRLGFFWSIAPPLLEVIVITFAFRQVTDMARKFDNYSAYLVVAMIPWTYTTTSVLDASQSILMMYGVIKKVYLPREIIPLAGVISNFIHFLLSWCVFFVYWWLFRRGPFLATTAWMPYLIMVQLMFVTALCLVVSCLNVFYEDVKYIVTVLTRLGLFVFPIMYIAEQVNAAGRLAQFAGTWSVFVYMNNPLTALISGYRKSLLEPPPPKVLKMDYLPLDVPSLALAGAVSFLLLVGAYAYFNSRKWYFVERP